MSKYHAISTNTKWQNWANINDPYDINNEYIDQFSGNKTRNQDVFMMAVWFRRDKLSHLTNNSYVRTCNIVKRQYTDTKIPIINN